MNNIEKSKLGRGLVETIVDKGALDLAADLGEAVLDSQLDDGILQNIPYIGSAIRLYKIKEGISDRILLKKILKFFGPLADISDAERKAFAEQLQNDANFRTEVSEQLMILIDRLDDMNKPDLLSWLFEQVIVNRLSYPKFREMAMAVDRCFLDDLICLDISEKHGSVNYEPKVASRLLGCGLLEIVSIPQIKGPGAANRYALTGLGRNFAMLYQEYLRKRFPKK